MGDCCDMQRFTPEGQGAIGDGVADDRAALQAAIDAVSRAGGGELRLAHGRTYRCVIDAGVTDRGLIIKDDVEVVGNGATIHLECTGDVYGVRLKNRATIRDCTVAVTASDSGGSQGIWHSAISVGPAYSTAGAVGSISSFEGVEGWRILNVIVSSVRDTGVAVSGIGIVVYGGAGYGVIDGITVPDSTTMYGAIHLDWGAIGTIVSADVAASRTNFDAGTAYSTHPHDIVICNIKCGNLSHAGAIAVRISGAHNILVENIDIKGCKTGGIYHHAGDLGYEFAQLAVKPFRHKRIVFRNVTVRDANDGNGCWVDCSADNIAAANNTLTVSGVVGAFQVGEVISGGTSGTRASIFSVAPTVITVANPSGAFTATETLTGETSAATATFGSVAYTPLLPPISRADIILENVHTFSDGGESVIAGIRIQWIVGATLINPLATGHEYGILIDAGGDEVTVVGGAVYANRRDGLYAGHGTDKPHNLIIDGLKPYQNDTSAATRAGVYLENCTNPAVRNCVFGKATETAAFGLRAISTVTSLTAEDNYVAAAKPSTGVGYSIGQSGDYSILRKFRNNTAASGVSTPYGGVEIVTTEIVLGTDGVARRHCYAAKAALTADITPTGGAWVAGERIYRLLDGAEGFEGSICTTGGTPGTWKTFGAITA